MTHREVRASTAAQANDIETAAAQFVTRIREASAAIRRAQAQRIRKDTP